MVSFSFYAANALNGSNASTLPFAFCLLEGMGVWAVQLRLRLRGRIIARVLGDFGCEM